MTIEVLFRTLQLLEKDGKPLPKRMFLQLDNTSKFVSPAQRAAERLGGRENKNKYLLAFLGNLVQRGVFTEVILGFLPVGHTHEVSSPRLPVW
jgi:hypothetical protein